MAQTDYVIHFPRQVETRGERTQLQLSWGWGKIQESDFSYQHLWCLEVEENNEPSDGIQGKQYTMELKF